MIENRFKGMNTFIQITMFPNYDSKHTKVMLSAIKTKKLPIETALDLFPRIERQLVFTEYFPGF